MDAEVKLMMLHFRAKTKPIVHRLGVTLEDLYNGKKKKLAANRVAIQ